MRLLQHVDQQFVNWNELAMSNSIVRGYKAIGTQSELSKNKCTPGASGSMKELFDCRMRSTVTATIVSVLLGSVLFSPDAIARSRLQANQSMRAGSLEGRVWVVSQNGPNASDEGPGSVRQPFKTISRAALSAQPGDEVLVHAGVYRERVAPARGGAAGRQIVYQAAPGESVVVTGADVLKGPFFAVDQLRSIYQVNLDPRAFRGFNPYASPAAILPFDAKFVPDEALHKTLGQVFVDGVPLLEVDNITQLKAVPSSWLATASGLSLLIHFSSRVGDPNHHHLVEYSVRNRVFAPYRRGLGYITVHGFTFEDCANPRLSNFWKLGGHQAGMVSTRSGNHWVIEDNVIRYAKSLGLDFGAEGGADQGPNPVPQSDVGWDLIRDNVIEDNGQGGAAGYISHFVRIVGNRFVRNNVLGWPSYEAAGLKTHIFYNGLIEGNLFLDNNCPGIWMDNTYSHDRVTRNLILNSVEEGIFVEMGFGPLLIDDNVIAYTRTGDGIYAHDSSGITVAHNLLLGNSDWGIRMRVVADRKALVTDQSLANYGTIALVQTSNERILENLLIDNYGGAITLPPHWSRSSNNISDFNAFATGSQTHWSGVYGPMFAFDDCGGRVKPDELKQDVFAHLQNLPQAEWPANGLWAQSHLLTLNQLQAVSGYEKHSLIARFKSPSTINPDSRMLSLTELELSVPGGDAPAVAGVDRDFLGHELPEKNPLPGPFQNLHPGENDLLLMPAILPSGDQ